MTSNITDNPKYYSIGYIDKVNLKRHGEANEYYANGNLYSKLRYFGGERHGPYVTYYENGNIALKGQYKNNLRSGAWTYYYENGFIKERLIFSKGQFVSVKEFNGGHNNTIGKDGNGNWNTLYFNDFIKSHVLIQGSYKSGLKHGKWFFHEENSMRFLNDSTKMDLVCEEVYENGRFLSGKYFSINGQFEELKYPTYQILPESVKYDETKRWRASIYAAIEDYPFLSKLKPRDPIMEAVDEVVKYSGGLDSLKGFISKSLVSNNIVLDSIPVIIHLKLYIDEHGNLTVLKEFGFPTKRTNYFRNMILKILRKSSGWIPAIRNNQPTKSYLTIMTILNPNKKSEKKSSFNTHLILNSINVVKNSGLDEKKRNNFKSNYITF